MFKENTIDDFDTGVSPVVGVILMVAVTVILAAVIGTFVLDLGGNVSQNAQAGVTFNEDAGTSVTVQTVSVQQADSIYVAQPDGDSAGEGTYGVGNSSEISSVGDSFTLDQGTNYSAGDTISVIGVLDGEESVIQTYKTES